jgi:hypothetical protein
MQASSTNSSLQALDGFPCAPARLVLATTLRHMQVSNVTFHKITCTSCEGGVLLAGAPDSYLGPITLSQACV